MQTEITVYELAKARNRVRAAAPELLAALRETYHALQQATCHRSLEPVEQAAIQAARAAIAKAEGR